MEPQLRLCNQPQAPSHLRRPIHAAGLPSPSAMKRQTCPKENLKTIDRPGSLSTSHVARPKICHSTSRLYSTTWKLRPTKIERIFVNLPHDHHVEGIIVASMSRYESIIHNSRRLQHTNTSSSQQNNYYLQLFNLISQSSNLRMKSFIAILALACAASAATLTPRAECHAKKLLACAKEGQMGCESNGGHSVSLSHTTEPGAFSC
jgi:hypothetical protein